MTACRHERDVRDAAADERWTPELSAHVASCRRCADVALVTRALAAPVAGPQPIADPHRLWILARNRRRQRAEALISRVVMGVQIAVSVLGLAGLGFAMMSMESWSPSALQGGSSTLLAAATSLVLLTVVGLSRLLSKDA